MTIYHQISGDNFSSNFSLPTQRYRHFVRGSWDFLVPKVPDSNGNNVYGAEPGLYERELWSLESSGTLLTATPPTYTALDAPKLPLSYSCHAHFLFPRNGIISLYRRHPCDQGPCVLRRYACAVSSALESPSQPKQNRDLFKDGPRRRHAHHSTRRPDWRTGQQCEIDPGLEAHSALATTGSLSRRSATLFIGDVAPIKSGWGTRIHFHWFHWINCGWKAEIPSKIPSEFSLKKSWKRRDGRSFRSVLCNRSGERLPYLAWIGAESFRTDKRIADQFGRGKIHAI